MMGQKEVAAPSAAGDPLAPTFGAALALAAERWPDQEAFVCDGVRLTYRDLYDAARRTAAALLARPRG